MSEHGKDHPDEFMSDGHDCLFVGESFLAFLEERFSCKKATMSAAHKLTMVIFAMLTHKVYFLPKVNSL